MDRIIKEVDKRILELNKEMQVIDEFLKKALNGSLSYKIVNDRPYYYQQTMGGKNSCCSNNSIEDNNDNISKTKLRADSKRNNNRNRVCNQKYIKKCEIQKVYDLAQKSYYASIKPLLEQQYNILVKFVENYNTSEIQKVYDNLCDLRKQLVVPIDISKEERIRQWEKEEYKENEYYSENKKYETDQGEYVRSKSEMIIANSLFKYRKDILYKYERPLEIVENGIIKTIYPDFTILNIHTGKITYFEHAGCMDNPSYANDFVKKMNNYILNNIIPGRDLITTYESRDYSLDVGVVRKMIEGLL